MEKNTSPDRMTNNFIDTFKKLCLNFENEFDEVCAQLLNEIKTMYDIDEVAIFRKIPYTLDFELYKHIGNKNQNYWDDIFQAMLDDGSIGNLLATCSILSTNFYEKSYLLSPLYSNKDFFGFIIAEYNPVESNNSMFKDFLFICSNYLSHKITNLELSNRIIELDQNMNLHIADRTINLVKNNQQLADKIRSLYKNLSMALPHEFRTPLNQILGNTDFLMKHYDITDPTEAKEIISDIYTSCRRLQTLIEHYLVLSQLELIAINIEQLDEIRNARTESVETSIYNILSSKSDYETRYEDFKIELEDASIQMSENFFVIMMTELIDNAVKYSEKGKPIYINTKVDTDYLNLKVIDYGMGINPEDLKKIDAYTQFERDKFEQQGLGLGLAIVLRIVDISNSKIKIDSKVFEYTKIEINIPVARN
jgi:signal transduction histidine kinase